jgi:hypothetical protein
MDYGAITIDTSIFDQKGLNLESGLLKTLDQFNGKPSPLILSEIVIREIHAHLVKKTSDVRGQVQKALRASKLHLTLDEDKIDEAEKLLIPVKDNKEVAKSRLELFIKNTGTEIVHASGHVELDELIIKYFKSQPPFSETGKKKNEFPDAIALMSLESWAKNNKTKILAVSDDGDWEAFAKESEHIDIYKDLAAAIAIFQPHNAAIDFCIKLSGDLPAGKPENLYSVIEKYLSEAVSEIDAYSDASSSFFWEPDIVEVIFESFEFVVNDEGRALMQPVQAQDESIVIEAKVIVTATASSTFSLSVHDSIDKDYVPIGSASASTEVEFETEILFTIEGDFVKEPDDVEITEFELLSYPGTIDFGDIEPDWWGEDE